MNLRKEILERNFWGMKFKGEKIWRYKIGETLERNKEERKGTIKWGGVTWERHL